MSSESAKKTGKTRQEVIENFIKNRDLMAVSGPPIYSPLSSDEYTMYEPPEEFSSVPVRPNSYPNYMTPQAPELDANPLSSIPPNMV